MLLFYPLRADRTSTRQVNRHRSHGATTAGNRQLCGSIVCDLLVITKHHKTRTFVQPAVTQTPRALRSPNRRRGARSLITFPAHANVPPVRAYALAPARGFSAPLDIGIGRCRGDGIALPLFFTGVNWPAMHRGKRVPVLGCQVRRGEWFCASRPAGNHSGCKVAGPAVNH